MSYERKHFITGTSRNGFPPLTAHVNFFVSFYLKNFPDVFLFAVLKACTHLEWTAAFKMWCFY